MLEAKSHLVRAQTDLAATLHDLQLEHGKAWVERTEADQAVRYPEARPRLQAGYHAARQVVLHSFV